MNSNDKAALIFFALLCGTVIVLAALGLLGMVLL